MREPMRKPDSETVDAPIHRQEGWRVEASITSETVDLAGAGQMSDRLRCVCGNTVGGPPNGHGFHGCDSVAPWEEDYPEGDGKHYYCLDCFRVFEQTTGKVLGRFVRVS